MTPEEPLPIGFPSAQSSSCNLDGVSVPWAVLDNLSPVPATQGPCLVPNLHHQALFGLQSYRRGPRGQCALLPCQHAH